MLADVLDGVVGDVLGGVLGVVLVAVVVFSSVRCLQRFVLLRAVGACKITPSQGVRAVPEARIWKASLTADFVPARFCFPVTLAVVLEGGG